MTSTDQRVPPGPPRPSDRRPTGGAGWTRGPEEDHLIAAGPVQTADEGAVRPLGHGRLAQDPVGTVELRLHVDQGLGHPPAAVRSHRGQPVRQPPPAPIVHEQEAPVPSPVRLAHRSLPPARHSPPGDQPDATSRLVHPRHPQLRAVPGHERVVPGDPGHPLPVGRWTRRGHEVPVVHEGDHRGPVGDRYGHQPVVGPAITVTLLHAQEPPPRGGASPVGESGGPTVCPVGRLPAVGCRRHGPPGQRCRCPRVGARCTIHIDPMPLLIGLVDVVQHPARDGGAAAAVLVHPAADADPRGRDVRRCPARGSDHHLAATVTRTALAPVEGPVVGLQLTAADLAGRGHRRGPPGGPPAEPSRSGPLGRSVDSCGRLAVHGVSTVPPCPSLPHTRPRARPPRTRSPPSW